MPLIITSIGDRLFKFINIDNLESQKGVFSVFFTFLHATHNSTLNGDKTAGDRPRQPAYEIFNIKGRF